MIEPSNITPFIYRTPTPSFGNECALESHHTRTGHLHYFIANDRPTTCFVEPPGISRVIPRRKHIHPSAFTYYDLRFESLRVGGTMIIVREDREVLEEIYPDKFVFLLTNGTYHRTPQTPQIHTLLADDYRDSTTTLIDHLASPSLTPSKKP